MVTTDDHFDEGTEAGQEVACRRGDDGAPWWLLAAHFGRTIAVVTDVYGEPDYIDGIHAATAKET